MDSIRQLGQQVSLPSHNMLCTFRWIFQILFISSPSIRIYYIYTAAQDGLQCKNESMTPKHWTVVNGGSTCRFNAGPTVVLSLPTFFQFWILPSLVGGSALYFHSVDQWHRMAAWLYGGGLTGLFVTSTLFHTAAWKISHLQWVCVGAKGASRDVRLCLCVFMLGCIALCLTAS